MRIALVQMRCEKGAVDENLVLIALQIKEAGEQGADIVCFPEMSITGYADPTRFSRAKLKRDGPELERFAAATRGYPCTVLAGFIEDNGLEKPFITQVVARDGEILGFYRKMTIIDEEAEWFSAGDSVSVFWHGNVRFGIAICADIHNEAVFAEYKRRGAQIVFEAAAPGLYGEQAERDWQSGFRWWEGECEKYLGRYAEELSLWIAVATQAGRTVDEDFPGGGYLFAPDGRRVFATDDWASGTVCLDINIQSNGDKDGDLVYPQAC